MRRESYGLSERLNDESARHALDANGQEVPRLTVKRVVPGA